MNVIAEEDKYLAQVRGNTVPEWEDEFEFLTWLLNEMQLSPGRKLIRFDETLPYGPDNCMLWDRMYKLEDALYQTTGIKFAKKHREMKKSHGEDVWGSEWKDVRKFVHWAQQHQKEIPFHAYLKPVDKTKPLAPDNVCFQVGAKKKEPVRDAGHTLLIRQMMAISQEVGVNFISRYASMKSRNTIDPDAWPKDDFYAWANEQYERGLLYPQMHLHKIDRSLPLSRDNVYASWRKEGNGTHGMAFTKLYRKWRYFVNAYRKELSGEIPFEEFMEHALVVRKYQPNQELSVEQEGKGISLKDVYFKDTEDYDDINRICLAYRTIPADENAFSGLMEFMEWTIRSGYTSWKEFRKVKEGVYSPNTCVWDLFSEESYCRHYNKINKMIERSKKQDYLYRKRANLKAAAGITKEWEDVDAFRLWCRLHQVDETTVVQRKDKAKPFGPDNVILGKKSESTETERRHPLYGRYKDLKRLGNGAIGWKDVRAFGRWYEKQDAAGCILKRIDTQKPFGPKNVVVVRPDATKELRKQIMYQRFTQLVGYEHGTDHWGGYENFLEWCSMHQIDETFRFRRIDTKKPFTPDNIRLPKAA